MGKVTDFRTWHGTVLAAVELAAAGPPRSRPGAERAIRTAIERVSEALGKTPTVCRGFYIDPRLLDRYRDGATIPVPASTNGRLTPSGRRRIERKVLALLS
jgi:DNA topoisomerase I